MGANRNEFRLKKNPRRGTAFWSQKYRNYRRLDGRIQDTFLKNTGDLKGALKIQAEIVILQEIQELQESVPRLESKYLVDYQHCFTIGI